MRRRQQLILGDAGSFRVLPERRHFYHFVTNCWSCFSPSCTQCCPLFSSSMLSAALKRDRSKHVTVLMGSASKVNIVCEENKEMINTT